jgi:NDP-sugar pyrophosphorylase family protein
MGTAGGVRNALPWLGDDPFVVLYGDVIIDEPIRALTETHRRAKAVATLAVYPATDFEGKGIVEVDQHNIVTAFCEKATITSSEQAYVNAGLYIMNPGTMRSLPQESVLDFGHDVFPWLLASSERKIAAHLLAAPVIDIGTPEALRQASNGG